MVYLLALQRGRILREWAAEQSQYSPGAPFNDITADNLTVFHECTNTGQPWHTSMENSLPRMPI